MSLAACGRIDFAPRTDDARVAVLDGSVDASSLAMGLIAYYPLDVSAGGAADLSGNGFTATCSTDCPSTFAGQVGNAAVFDGSMQKLTIPFDSMFTTAVGFSISAWIRPGGIGNHSMIAKMHSATATANTWQIEIPNTNAIAFKLRSLSQADVFVTYNSVAVDAWQHVAAVWTGALAVLYVDGIERDSAAVNDVVFDSNPSVIGADINNGAPGGHWLGALDEIRIYGRPLTAAEVAVLAMP